VDLPGRASGLLAAWGTAWLAGLAPLDDAVAAVHEVGEEVVVIRGGEPVGLDRALLRLRADGVRALEPVLPVAGDARGLPGPGPFTTGAIEAGEGVLSRGASTRVGLAPEVVEAGTTTDGFTRVLTWHWYDVDPPDVPQTDVLAPPLPDLAEAEGELRTTLASCTRALSGLQVARAGPVAEEARRSGRVGGQAARSLPEGYPPRALDLLASAEALAHVAALGLADDGGARTLLESDRRTAALREVATAARRARVAAYGWLPAQVLRGAVPDRAGRL